MSTHKKFAHEMVANVAKEMAATFYEDLAHDNDFYAFYPKQQEFIKREWQRFLPMAKQQLTLMLGDSVVAEWQKEQIFEALVKHSSLPGNIDPRVAHKMINEGDVPDIMKRIH